MAGVIAAASAQRRRAVVDLGSNSVRLVVFEGDSRTPTAIFNEKAVLRLGRGLQGTGQLDPAGLGQAIVVMRRYHAVARAMRAEPFEVLATAAVRDASNGPEFVAQLRAMIPDARFRILTGDEEASLSADGLVCGIPEADGILADIGGGSLEVVRIVGGRMGASRSLKLGLIRLSERAGGDPVQARAITEADLATVPWIGAASGLDLYLVGGAWRAIARMHIAMAGYPLNIVDRYTIEREAARAFAGDLASANKRTLERMTGVSRRRAEDLPFAGVVLRRLLRASGASRVVFSASGLREGWYVRQIDAAARGLDPLLATARDLAQMLGREAGLPPALIEWTAPLFPHESGELRRQREAVCWLSDIGSHDHPEYRAEQAFLRVLRQPSVGLDHRMRAFLAMAVAIRYDAEPGTPFLQPAMNLLPPEPVRRATILGCALRLAYTLSGGVPDLLSSTRLEIGARLGLTMPREGGGVFEGEAVTRRLARVATAMGIEAANEAA
jgi:exopolyphosphatase/guanosine-5'-triphosphate,3'-diphosphate pyrophosphatase